MVYSTYNTEIPMTIEDIFTIAYANEIAAENKRKERMKEIITGCQCSLLY